MSTEPILSGIVYPESDGQPMGETDLHISWLIYIRSILRRHFRKQPVYVGANLILYYRQGDPRASVVPDLFVTCGVARGRRTTYLLWQERQVPHWVLEITSDSTVRRDVSEKRDLYAELGVRDYFVFDPSGDLLSPPLQGWSLVHGVYQPLVEDDAQGLPAQSIGLSLQLRGKRLALIDPTTGRRLRTDAEAERAARIRLHKRIQQELTEERAARLDLEARMSQLEEWLRRQSPDPRSPE